MMVTMLRMCLLTMNYEHIAHMIVEVMTPEVVTRSSWRTMTCKQIYSKFSETFPVPRVEVEAGVSYATFGRD
jgi:hypothetical protein